MLKSDKNRHHAEHLPLLILALAFLLSFSLGRYPIPMMTVLKIFISRIIPLTHTWDAQMESVVLAIRLPRILLAMGVGAALSAAGATYQGIFQNPMASPDILGSASGSAFGAALAILLGCSSAGITIISFAGGLLAIILVFFISRRGRGNILINLILSGMMVSSLLSAGTSYIKLVADPSNQLPAITFWLMGSLSGARMDQVLPTLIIILISFIPLILFRWRFNLLTLGDEEAKSLGVNTKRLRAILITAATLATSTAIASAGMIGWVGLVIPHLARKIVGNDYRRLMPCTMITGAAFMLIVDNISRNLLAVEIPIGIITAFIGAPFFIFLICRKERIL